MQIASAVYDPNQVMSNITTQLSLVS